MRILYFGTSAFAIPPLRALVATAHSVVAVVTQPDRPAGRGGRLTPPPVKVEAERLGLPVLQPTSCRTPECLDAASALAPTLSVVAAYGQFLPDALLTLPPLGSVNLHGSLLPRYRGAAPIQRAILEGATSTGVCLMWMVRAMDAGDVIACAETALTPEDTAGTLTERLSVMAADLLVAWLPALAAGTAPRIPQNEAAVTFAPPLAKDERVLDWAQPADALWRRVRALAPAPGAVTTWRGKPLKVLEASPLAGEAGDPGTVVEATPGVGLHVMTGAGALALRAVQPAGKRVLSADDFLRGYRVARGEHLGL